MLAGAFLFSDAIFS